MRLALWVRIQPKNLRYKQAVFWNKTSAASRFPRHIQKRIFAKTLLRQSNSARRRQELRTTPWKWLHMPGTLGSRARQSPPSHRLPVDWVVHPPNISHHTAKSAIKTCYYNLYDIPIRHVVCHHTYVENCQTKIFVVKRVQASAYTTN